MKMQAKKQNLLQVVVAILSVMFLFTACASKATNAAEKIELGQKYLTESNYTEAVAAFTEVIKLDPSNIEAYMGRAEAYKGLKQYDDAKTDYTAAIEKTDEMPYTQAQAYTGRAEVYTLTEESAAAESDYTSALRLLDREDIGKKENIAEKLIRNLKIKVLQLHAEICMKLELYDKVYADYEKLEMLGINMSDGQNDQEGAGNQTGGVYNWYYSTEGGIETNCMMTIQAGRSQLDALIKYGGMDEDKIAAMLLSFEIISKHGSLDPENMTQEEMITFFTDLENGSERLQGENWRPQFLETVILSAPISRVEKVDDTLYVYVPTGTHFVDLQMIATSYGGKAISYSLLKLVDQGTDLSKPVYEMKNSDSKNSVVGSFKIEYREDK